MTLASLSSKEMWGAQLVFEHKFNYLAGSAHAAFDAMRFQQFPKSFAGILRSAVRMMDQPCAQDQVIYSWMSRVSSMI